MFDTDCVPIIAHVERYPEVIRHPALLSELTDMGCLLQVNTSSFLDKSTKGFVFALLKHGWVHCLGTDTHNMAERAPDYAAAKKAIEEAGYGDRFEQIQETMQAVWDNRSVKIAQAKPVKKFFGIYH
jgi:protein-tyrosine phosphatase